MCSNRFSGSRVYKQARASDNGSTNLPKAASLLTWKSPAVQENFRSMVFGVKNGDLNAKPMDDMFLEDFYDQDLFQLGQDWVKPGVAEEERMFLL